jgi:superfamily II DNA or RNA helicase
MMDLRKHQADFNQLIDNIIAGEQIRQIIVNATPGSGKSLLPILAGRLIQARLADALAWIVPRKALQSQGERGFVDPAFRAMLGHNLTVRQSTNDIDPCRGLNGGWISTYQALSMDNRRLAVAEFSTKRYILILDEFHHVSASAEADWFKAISPLVEKAKYLVMLTGTMERGDGKPIAWLPYRKAGTGLLEPMTEDHDDVRYIHYDRATALSERAILPIEFTLYDGHVEWEKDGEHRQGMLSNRFEDAGQALFTALNTEFAEKLLENGLAHWQRYKADHPRSKLLIVTANFDHAKQVMAQLKQQGFHAKIATSHDSAQCLKNIHEFKFGNLDLLVTIAVAYEGLSVKPITHIICLTQIRSTSWITQMVGRAVRIDPQAGPYETQRAYVFAPDDFLFRAVVDQIKAEQLAYVKEAQDREQKERARNGEGSRRPPDVIPLGSTLTGERSFSIGDISPIDMHPQTPTDIEQALRKQIEDYVKEFAFKNYYKIERINAEIKAAFGKPRAEMTLSELRSAMSFIRDAYPLNGQSLVSVVSQPRGRGRRTRAKAEEVEAPKQMGLWG